MMRVLLLSLVLVLAGTFSWASFKNPWMRACGIEQGQFWIVKSGSEELTMCYFGEAAIGAETLFLFKSHADNTDAVEAYKNRLSTASVKGGVCGAFGAELFEGKDNQGRSTNICRFSDQSLIEETTLWLGAGASVNEDLDLALSKKY